MTQTVSLLPFAQTYSAFFYYSPKWEWLVGGRGGREGWEGGGVTLRWTTVASHPGERMLMAPRMPQVQM